jgi:hypothetical protein
MSLPTTTSARQTNKHPVLVSDAEASLRLLAIFPLGARSKLVALRLLIIRKLTNLSSSSAFICFACYLNNLFINVLDSELVDYTPIRPLVNGFYG